MLKRHSVDIFKEKISGGWDRVSNRDERQESIQPAKGLWI